MNYFRISILLCLATSTFGQQVSNKNVLFIGNSLTYYNGMPEYLKAMLGHTNQRVIIETSTFPGMALESHLDEIIVSRTENGINTRKKNASEQTETEKKILSRKWDLIILQEATIRALIPEFRRYSTQEAIERIKKLINDRDCHLVLFKTWAPNGIFPTQFCYPAFMLNQPAKKDNYCSLKINSLEEESSLLSTAYDSVAVATKIDHIDIGDKFSEIITKFPTLKLYDTESHPTKFGAYLNACLFYKFILETRAIELSYYGDLNKDDAIFLQKIAN